MANPFPPQLTGDNTRDILALQRYLYDVLVDVRPDEGWSVVGGTGLKTLDVNGTLNDGLRVLGQLIQVLIEKDILSA